jgi:hypothetical protein
LRMKLQGRMTKRPVGSEWLGRYFGESSFVRHSQHLPFLFPR